VPTIPPYPRALQGTSVYPSRNPLPEQPILNMEFESDDDGAQVFAFYRDTLASAGWRAVGSTSLENTVACPFYVLYFSQRGDWHELRLVRAECIGR